MIINGTEKVDMQILIIKKTYQQLSSLVIFLMVLLFSPYIQAVDLEQKLKAVYLGRLSSFITWPPEKKPIENSHFELCVLGKASFKPLLDNLYNNKKIKEKPVVIRNFKTIEEVTNCDILFISESERTRVTEVLDYAQDKSILTVGETQGFAEKNGMVQFYVKNQKVKIKINHLAAKNQGFFISARLLAVAKVINRK